MLMAAGWLNAAAVVGAVFQLTGFKENSAGSKTLGPQSYQTYDQPTGEVLL